ncbi:MAG: hypothetical protein WC152_03470 [Candidatus Izemoplasmatales bacterium]
MKRKILCLNLVLIMLFAYFAISAFAQSKNMEIYLMRANTKEAFESATTIYTYADWGEDLCKDGNAFEWSKVVVFDYDEVSQGYRCIATYELIPPKNDVKIPENGFVIAANGGNNWPDLFESANGSEWYYNAVSPSLGIPYSECPNFITPLNIANSYALDSIEVGDVIYLSGIDFADAVIDSNESEEIHYWDDSFVSNSYLSFVKPDGYIDPFAEEPSSEEPTTEEPTTEEPTTEEPTTEEPITEEPSGGGESESSTQTPYTGDADLFIFALITLIAAAGAVIIRRTR